MALFQRRPQGSDVMKYYSLGQNKSVVIVGLGNIGKEYEGTRHNLGFAVLNHFRETQNFPDWIEKKDLKCRLASLQMGDTKVTLVKPTTYMNNSGEAVQAVVHFYKIDPGSIIVIHDELDIPFGQIRTRTGGSSAGNNGIKSVTHHMGEQYGRVRIGIGPKTHDQMDSADFVLGKFSSAETTQLPNLYREASAILSEYVYGGQLVSETRSFIV